jgi:hypothetical protein
MQMLSCRLEGRRGREVAGDTREWWVVFELRNSAPCVDAKTHKDHLRAVEAMNLGQSAFSFRGRGQEANESDWQKFSKVSALVHLLCKAPL